jgi:fluoride ion exporter CrcB/FEX
MTPEILGLTVALGSLGAVIRYLVQTLWLGNDRRYGAIIVVNLVGSALAGVLTALPGSPLTVALVAGLCGGLTTFSTVALHLIATSDSLTAPRRVGLGVAHIGGSMAAVLVAFQIVSLVS